MKRWSATLLVLAVCSAVVHADVTVVQKTTVEGGAAAMAPGGIPSPTMTTRIKGTKGRSDMDMGTTSIPTNMSTITDAAAKQVTLLDHNQKTARVSTAGQKPPAPAADAPTGTVQLDGSVTPTGKTQTIDGYKCDEYSFTTTLSMSDMAGGSQLPPEAAAAMQGIKMVMKGSLWVTKDAPGMAEYRDYQKAMASADLTSAAMGATGVNMPGMDKLVKAMTGVDGLPVLTEMDMTIEGTGPMADMMRQMGAMKITTKVLSVKTDSIPDDVFKVPEGYQVIK
jgi:Domain of unknown function (DUF4412)